MITCSSSVTLPAWRVFALGAAVQLPCVVLLHVVGVVVFALRRQRALAFLLWPAAAAIGAAPFWLFPWCEALLPAPWRADAQFGIFCGATAFSFAAFRTIEAALGNTPIAATTAVQPWLLYFTASLDPRYAEGKAAVPAPGALGRRFARIPARMLALGALASLLAPHGASPLDRELARRLQLSARGCLWVENVVYSVHLWLFLALCFDIGACLLLAQGVDVGEAFRNPVFAAESPKEFWGKRWNLQVNAILRRVAFKPLARLLGAAPAAVATFGVSACFHEYQFRLTFGPAYRCGRASAFFAAMGGLCLVQTLAEKALSVVPGGWKALGALPHFAKVALNILTLMPFGHWFVHIWLDHGMVATIAKMVPTVVCRSG